MVIRADRADKKHRPIAAPPPAARAERARSAREEPARFEREGRRRPTDSVRTQPLAESSPGASKPRNGVSLLSRRQLPIPTTAEEAEAILARLGFQRTALHIRSGEKIDRAAGFLQVYAPEARETKENLKLNLRRPGYRLSLVERAGQPVGVLSGEKFDNGLAIIDYHSLLEAPRDRTDVKVGRALLRPFLDELSPRALFVEATDMEMQRAYERVGFKVIAHPPRSAKRGERLTMMILPVTVEAKKRMRRHEGRAELMEELRTEWYAKNWSGVEGAAYEPARLALRAMKAAQDRGELIWIQKLIK